MNMTPPKMSSVYQKCRRMIFFNSYFIFQFYNCGWCQVSCLTNGNKADMHTKVNEGRKNHGFGLGTIGDAGEQLS